MFNTRKILKIYAVTLLLCVNAIPVYAIGIPSNLPDKIKTNMSYLDYYGFQDVAGIRSRSFSHTPDNELEAQLRRQQSALEYLQKLPDEEKTAEVKQLIQVYEERVENTQKEIDRRKNPEPQKDTEEEDINTDGSEPAELDIPDTGDSDLPPEVANSTPTESVSAASSETITPKAPLTITTKTTTIKDGKVTTETTTGTLGEGTISTGDGSNTNSNNGSTKSESKQPDAASKTPAKEEDKATEIQFTGVYKDRQIIPTTMAIHCKMNAEDVLKDMNKLEQCMRQYITELNSKSATAKAKAAEEYGFLRHDVLKNMLTTAIGQKMSVNNYENKMNEYGKATSEAKTKRDSEAATSNTQAFSTNVMNTVREVYIEILKNNGINGYAEIDPSALIDAIEKSDKAKRVEENMAETTEEGINVEVKIASEGQEGDDMEEVEVTYLGNNQCEAEGATHTCDDGTYKDKYGNEVRCKEGFCANTNSADGAVVIGDASKSQTKEEAPKAKEDTPPAKEETSQEKEEELDPGYKYLMEENDTTLLNMQKDAHRNLSSMAAAIEKAKKTGKTDDLETIESRYQEEKELLKQIEIELKRRKK